ncbi:SGNH/GDSL hydrolase family protein [Pedobacter sp. BS3]|uniref:SGNH/GDSL hydrolase family protein n=1 Tax=Pedobacter sp. BS3 TaxID=2567937 RepID=UPI0011EBB9E0|nr:SGNH/GDSL hydrolase family protein [Pedobacter sp. BS3]TZF84721.1 SGNH/GDSL hydrolase family protein [Pedobacter sp. BS3]
MNNRRNFIKTAALGVIGSSLIPEIVAAAMPETSKAAGKIRIPDNATILFQGDSITDAHRDRKQTSENNAMGLGTGYALGAASTLLLDNPSKNLKIYNRGISGNKVYQLADRWEEDCLAIKPDILSILVGVNDYWHTLSGKYKGTIKTYRDDFKALLDRTKNRLPDVKLIIGEPYAVNGVKAVTDAWFPAFYEYQKAARELAESFGAVFIPYQKVYDTAQKMAPGSYWTPDGVHPSVAGARLMAEAWLKAVKG